jgi:shikimate kinase
MEQHPIWLVGMMGAGKSAVGPVLACSLGRRFVDSDQEIERAAGIPIIDIFEKEGESSFRRREADTLEALSRGRDVVALGGGAIAQPGAAELLGRTGLVVYLEASPNSLLERLGDCAARPLLADLSAEERLGKLVALLAERRPAYESAAMTIDTDARDVQWVVDEILQRMEAASLEGGRAIEKGAMA